ncbi:MAG: hypothetical protein ACLQVY_02410 [Limisphaerales bacterium]
MALELIGAHPFERDELGRQKVRIGTLFPEHRTLYTLLPGVHAWQRSAFIDLLNTQRAKAGAAPLTLEQEEEICRKSVDLIFEPEHILIRPNPARMDLAFAADELLQELISKRLIVFLSVSDRRVVEAIKHRGECWRLSSIPTTKESKARLILSSKVAIQEGHIYFYNRLTGTRWLTCEEFSNLGKLDDAALARQLQEIATYSIRLNHIGRPEVAFFATDLRHFGPALFSGIIFAQLASPELRAKYEELKLHFVSAVHEAFRRDECGNEAWSHRMIATLFLEGNETETDQILSGLSSEFYLRVEWLPGGRFEEGEFILDPLFDEAANHPEDQALQRLFDPRAKGIIFNLIREYGDLEYINLSRIPESLSQARPQKGGRRGVYLAEFRLRGERQPIKRFMRLLKWGVWEHLDEGKDLFAAIQEADEYTDYWLDRRLGCRQLGMNLLTRVMMRQLNEIYTGTAPRYRGKIIRTTYFERDYLEGIASDKVPMEKLARPDYAIKLAALLGKAAAASIIVGRSLYLGTCPVFDDGDEVIREGEDGVPADILVSDHSGAFGDYKSPLTAFAEHYARPVNIRAKLLSNGADFAQAYLVGLQERFVHIQQDYRKRRRGFDTLFKHCPYDPGGSFAYRWERVLARLDQTDPKALFEAIGRQIWILNPK